MREIKLRMQFMQAASGRRVEPCQTVRVRPLCVQASSVNMFKNKIDKYLVKAGYT